MISPERPRLHEDPARPRVALRVHGRALHVQARARAELREGAENDEVRARGATRRDRLFELRGGHGRAWNQDHRDAPRLLEPGRDHLGEPGGEVARPLVRAVHGDRQQRGPHGGGQCVVRHEEARSSQQEAEQSPLHQVFSRGVRDTGRGLRRPARGVTACSRWVKQPARAPPPAGGPAAGDGRRRSRHPRAGCGPRSRRRDP